MKRRPPDVTSEHLALHLHTQEVLSLTSGTVH